MPLEALRWDVTPIGLHYLLTHFDIPRSTPRPGGSRSAASSSAGSRSRSTSSVPDGRRGRRDDGVRRQRTRAHRAACRSASRGSSKPSEPRAGGASPSPPFSRRQGPQEGAVEALFTGLDRGIDGGEEQAYERSLPLDMLLEGDALLAYEVNGVPLPPQHGFPLRLVVPGWYGMTSVKWLSRITLVAEPFDGYQMSHAYRVRQEEDEAGEPITTIAPRSLMVPPGHPGVPEPRRASSRPARARSSVAPGRGRRRSPAWTSRRTAARRGRPPSSTIRRSGAGRGARGASRGMPSRASTSSAAVRATREGTSSRSSPWNVGGYVNNAVQRVRSVPDRSAWSADGLGRRASCSASPVLRRRQFAAGACCGLPLGMLRFAAAPAHGSVAVLVLAGGAAAFARGARDDRAPARRRDHPARGGEDACAALARAHEPQAGAEGRDALRVPRDDDRRVLDEEHARPAHDRVLRLVREARAKAVDDAVSRRTRARSTTRGGRIGSRSSSAPPTRVAVLTIGPRTALGGSRVPRPELVSMRRHARRAPRRGAAPRPCSGRASSGPSWSSIPATTCARTRETEPIGPGSSTRKIKDGGGTRGVVSGLREAELNLSVALRLRASPRARRA